jgi:ATP-binding cassette, subfamily B, multidrug efflux pump
VGELLRQYIRPYRGLVAVLVALQLISTLASLYLPTVNAAIIDDGVIKGDTETIVRLGGVMLAVTGLQVLCSFGSPEPRPRSSAAPVRASRRWCR